MLLNTSTSQLVKPKHGGKRHPSHPDQQASDLLSVKAYELRLQGFSYPQIAQQLGYADKSGAYRAVVKAQQACVVEKREELRDLELSRLDQLLTKLAPSIERGDVSAILASLKVMERRAKLIGLDILPETHPNDAARDERAIKARILELVAGKEGVFEAQEEAK